MIVKSHGLLLLVALLTVLGSIVAVRSGAAEPAPATHPGSAPAPLPDEALIIDHTCTDLSKVPIYWIEQAREHLVHYAHTSHGGQIVEGMAKLAQQDATYDFYHLLAPPDHPPTELPLFCGPDQLCMYDGQPGYDSQPYEDYITPELYWATLDGTTRTRVVADTGLYSYSMWSWCGQQSDNPVETVQLYMDTLLTLEQDYPGMRFILMTGHTDGGGEILARNNNMVRQFAVEHGMVLFDFADIETYAPDGSGPYDNDGEGTCEWCDEWCAAHLADCEDLPTSCAHTDYQYDQKLFCKLKANAFWWMMARLAGWDGTPAGEPDLSPTAKTASVPAAAQGDIVEYTIRIENAGAPPTTTVYLADVVPGALSYIPDSLAATSGTPDDSAAPLLRWSGDIAPSPVVTITYAVTVTGAAPGWIANTAVLAVPGYEPIARTAGVLINGRRFYLPVVMKG